MTDDRTATEPIDAVDDPDATDPDATDRAPSADGTADAVVRRPRKARRELSDGWARLIMAVLLIGAIVGLVLTVRAATTGNDSTSSSKPDFVDRLIPESGSEVLRQATVGIDVAAGHDAYLVINGTEVRGTEDGLTKDLGTGLIQYVPGPGKPVEELLPERNCVIAMVWKQQEGEASAQPVSWCFNAA